METVLVDVGQGSCQVILLGGRRAIVLDAGPRPDEVTRVLDRFHVDRLVRLIVSHLDADHAGGAPALLTAYRGRIDQVCLPNDHRAMTAEFARRAAEEVRHGHLAARQVVRLERPTTRDLTVWADRPAAAKLALLSPVFGENQLAMLAADANATCGILVLEVGAKRVVFAGDATLDQWRAIRARRQRPLTCDVLTVPHHAGRIWPAGLADDEVGHELDWLYSEAVRADLAVVSVGSRNQHRHPRPDVIAAARRAGVELACTQIGRQCCDNLERARSDNLPLGLPGRSVAAPPPARRRPDGTRRQRPGTVACAGSVLIEIGPDRLRVQCRDRHQAFVARVQASGGMSLCRR